tara:strand:+ start:200 stop:928 length:729 start_codon:yes stop_codon:yes gene_type:complete
VKITHLIEKEEAWPYFENFCISSKPYDFCVVGSPSLRQRKIKRIFNHLSRCEIYKAEEDNKIIGFVFLEKEEYCLDVNFLFGVRRNFTSQKLIKAAHAIFDVALKDLNKNYLKSEIRRTYKIDSYKKWIERYDKRAIIFNDDNNTVVWCNIEDMSVKFEIVGVNPATEHLMGKEAVLGITHKNPHNPSILREIIVDDDSYLFDEKAVDFLSDSVLVHGYLSDNEKKAGRIALKFIPQNEETI